MSEGEHKERPPRWGGRLRFLRGSLRRIDDYLSLLFFRILPFLGHPKVFVLTISTHALLQLLPPIIAVLGLTSAGLFGHPLTSSTANIVSHSWKLLSYSVIKLLEMLDKIPLYRGSCPVYRTVIYCSTLRGHLTCPAKFMAYVYILRNQKGVHYVGITALASLKRLDRHNRGDVFSTRWGRPWELVHSEHFVTLDQARAREKQIKSWKGGNALRKLLSGAAGSSNGRTRRSERRYLGSNPSPAASDRSHHKFGGVK